MNALFPEGEPFRIRLSTGKVTVAAMGGLPRIFLDCVLLTPVYAESMTELEVRDYELGYDQCRMDRP